MVESNAPVSLNGVNVFPDEVSVIIFVYPSKNFTWSLGT